MTVLGGDDGIFLLEDCSSLFSCSAWKKWMLSLRTDSAMEELSVNSLTSFGSPQLAAVSAGRRTEILENGSLSLTGTS